MEQLVLTNGISMTVSKNENWGITISRPENLVVVASDWNADQYLSSKLSNPSDIAPMAIRHSGLASSLGLVGANLVADEVLATKFDAIRIDYKTRNAHLSTICLGHAVLRNSWWRSSLVAVCNVSRFNNLDWAPKAHPNDGKFDVLTVDGSMSYAQRVIASRRMRFGTHVPHPKIIYRQVSHYQVSMESEANLFVDRQKVNGVVSCEFTVLPDFVTLCW